MNIEAKQITAEKIKSLINSLNDQIEVAHGLDLRVTVRAPHKLSDLDEQVTVEIFERINY